ncbi:MAG TPA: DNA-binding domain-containing protein [Steroidobacteraceae bacterium]|nr:DNA-binding domain-containing protein [Steroidobacteraceae bacterium]
MPTLLETQRELQGLLLGDEPLPTQPHWLQRLSIYRNTCFSTLVSALRLSFPAVQRLVGDEFFEGAARQFIAAQPPTSAYLNEYGARFPAFLRGFAPAAGLPYLGDVAELEWAVNRALHAEDAAGIGLAQLTGLGEAALPHLRFVPHPALTLLQLATPADVIWNAVLNADDAALAALTLTGDAVLLLVERDTTGVQVRRLQPEAWQFTRLLCEGAPLHAALAGDAVTLQALLADHLVRGRFVQYRQNP